MKFKYQTHINALLEEGLNMPILFKPINQPAFRFVFGTPNKNNNIPVLIQNPHRKLPNNVRLSGYALSCFDNKTHAENRYRSLCKSFKKAPLIIGDTLSSGLLQPSDGMITKIESSSGHYDLYESEECNLNETLTKIETLWSR